MQSIPQTEQACGACGATDGLVWKRKYVAGVYVWLVECEWEPGCWFRQDSNYEARRAAGAVLA